MMYDTLPGSGSRSPLHQQQQQVYSRSVHSESHPPTMMSEHTVFGASPTGSSAFDGNGNGSGFRRRRKLGPRLHERVDYRLARLVLRFVFASPVVIVGLYGAAVLIGAAGTTRQLKNNNNSSSNNNNSNHYNKLQAVHKNHNIGNHNNHHSHNHFIPLRPHKNKDTVMMTMPETSSESMGGTVVAVRHRPHPRQPLVVQPNYFPQQQDEQLQELQQQQQQALVAPLGQAEQIAALQLQNALQLQQQQPVMMASQARQDLMTQQQMHMSDPTNPSQSTYGGNPPLGYNVAMNAASVIDGATAAATKLYLPSPRDVTQGIPVISPIGSTRQAIAATATATAQQLPDPKDVAQAIPVISPLGSSQQQQLLQLQQQSPPKTAVYYYDASASQGENGTLVVPDVVFDQHGTPVLLSALQASEVYIEPPQRPVAPPPKQASFSRSPVKISSQPPPQDEYIIVATVAVMAVLVGAFSARRMRSKSFLGVCIENEALEEEVAYDATTTTTSEYNTFGGSWKGDLEKFDV